MTTIAATIADTNVAPVPAEEQNAGRLRFSLSEVVSLMQPVSDVAEPFDLETLESWVNEAQTLLKRLRIQLEPVSVEGDTIHVNESAMLYDTVYPVELGGTTYHVIFTSDDAIQIYEVAP